MSLGNDHEGNLRRIVYISSATDLPSEAELLRLLKRARSRNEAEGVSGMLLYGEGAFVQTLEGPGMGIERIFESIRRDPRHHRIRVLLDEPTKQRSFSHWRMGFKRVFGDQATSVEGFSDFMETAGLPFDEASRSDRAIQLMLRFKSLC